ncbi:MAG: DNA ligase D, partial [Sphingomonas sp.]|nr:DNA ligase D [Sphingomonas sp.]
IDGVLKSWAVTRGPSLDPDQKRLAVRTEDHPLSYAEFEGTIPAGEYGGGTVMLWDEGSWAPIAGKSAADLEKGHLHFVLDGQRMKGEWLLIRLKPRGREKRENWLLRKIDDAQAGAADTLTETALTSVKTGRTMREIADGVKPKRKARDKTMRRPDPLAAAPPSGAAGEESGPGLGGRGDASLGVGSKRAKAKPTLPPFQEPQLCTLVDTVPSGGGWVHEMKYDGYRALIALAGGKAKVFTRHGHDWSAPFASIADAAAKLPARRALIDGEIVAFKEGRPDFATLRQGIDDRVPLDFFAFDLLELDGEDLRDAPLVERKARLRALIPADDARLHFADHIAGSGEALFETMCREGMEGIVSKRADAPYRGGRGKAWLKVKCTRRQEFVIIGYMPAPRGFRSLLLGLHEDGALRYAGKVGTGFDAAAIADLLGKLEQRARDAPTVAAPRAAVRGARWVAPELVAEIAFSEWTPDKVLRHASFLGLRDDKPAAEVVREEPAAPVPAPAFETKVTHPERVLFERSSVTKGQLADYYAALAAPLLAVAARRPISLVRCPQGRAKRCFFQKHDAGSFGDAVRQIDVREKDGTVEPYLYVDDLEGLIACVQMGTIEFHGWGARAGDIERPDRLVFDLDPDEGLGFAEVREAAAFLKNQLAEIGLVSFAMLSGGKGVHVVVPLTPRAEWPAVKSFAHRFAEALAQAYPDRFTANMSKAKRRGRIFIDWLRNQRGATAVMPYSARARPGAPVAAPVTWTELRAVETAAMFGVTDRAALLARAASADLAGWGVAAQVLPDV